MPPSAPKLARVSSGALPALAAAALLILAGAGASWYERGIEARALQLADEIAVSVVPDEALVPSAVKGARAENAALSAALAARFAPRAEPVVALRMIESAADAAGLDSNFSRVEVDGWSGHAETFDALEPTASGTPYAAVVADVQASGTWAKALSLAGALDALPLASRVDSLRLASGIDKLGKPAWALTAQVSVAAK
jgi:hypothetical protein